MECRVIGGPKDGTIDGPNSRQTDEPMYGQTLFYGRLHLDSSQVGISLLGIAYNSNIYFLVLVLFQSVKPFETEYVSSQLTYRLSPGSPFLESVQFSPVPIPVLQWQTNPLGELFLGSQVLPKPHV